MSHTNTGLLRPKILAAVFTMAAMLLTSVSAFAGEGDGTTVERTVGDSTAVTGSAEQDAELRQDLVNLARAMGADVQDAPAAQPPASEPTAASKPEPSKKNMAEVADRALDMMGGMLAKISKQIEKAAPEVWKIMVRQQYAKAIGNLIVPWSMFLFFALWWRFWKSKWGYPDFSISWNDEEHAKLWFTIIVPGVCGAAFFLWGADRLAESALYLINPEYYAIRDLITLLLNKGQGM